ncbi:hypothetical protein ACFSTC_38280 [Nonomuraea ferruginea]
MDDRDVHQGEPGRLRHPGQVLRLPGHPGPFQGRVRRLRRRSLDLVRRVPQLRRGRRGLHGAGHRAGGSRRPGPTHASP